MKYYNFFIAILIFFITLASCSKNKESTIIENNLSIRVNESIIDEPLDLSIQNILIYPNQFDKNSIYIDVEILSINGGNGEVQIALLTDKIETLSKHVKQYKKDKHSSVGLLKAVNKRKKLLNYLKKNKIDSYKNILTKLNLRK